MTLFNKILSLIIILVPTAYASQLLDSQLEEGQVRIFPTALHEIDALTGPNIADLPLSKRQEIPEERKELHNLVLDFMSKFIWQTKEEFLFKLDNDEEELYGGVKMNLSFRDANGKSIVVIHNSAHPSFVTRGGDGSLDCWNEYLRQKNLCFVNDLWAHLLPSENITPTRDFYIAMQRLALSLTKEESINYVFKGKPDKLQDIMNEMLRLDLYDLEKVSEKLYSWATTYLSIIGEIS